MGVLTQHCERSLDMPRATHTIVDDFMNRLTWTDLDMKYTLRMNQMMTRDQLLNDMLGNWADS